MTTTSTISNYARFVGRVGALAVALGIGVAIVDSPAIASAGTGSSDSSSKSTKEPAKASKDGSTAESSAPERGPRKPALRDGKRLAKRLDSLTSKVESALDNAKVGSNLSTRRSSADQKSDGKPAKPAEKIETAVDSVRRAVSRAVNTAADAPVKPRPTVTDQPLTPAPADSLKTTVSEVANNVVKQAIPVLAPRSEAVPARVVPELVAAVFSTERLKPRIPEAPVNPVQDLGLAALLGWSRRDGRHQLTAINPIGRPAVDQTAELTTSDVSADPTSILATEDQLAAEQQVSQIVNTPIVQVAKLVLMAAWYGEALVHFSAVGGPNLQNLAQLNQAASEYANESATQFLLLNSNDPKLLLQVNPPHTWNGQDAGGTRVWYDNPDTVYRFTGINGASTYEIQGKIEGYDPADPSTHPTSANTNFSVLTGINGVTAENLDGEQLSIRDDGTFTIVVSPNAAPENAAPGMNYIQAPANSTILATRNTLGDWNTETPMTLTIEQTDGPPSSLFSQIGGFAIPVLGETVVKNPALMNLVSIIPAFDKAPLLLSSTETALLMLVTGISGENTYMTVATDATGEPNTLSQPAHNAQFLSTQLQSAGYFDMDDDEAMIITVYPGDAEYFVVPVTNDWTITNDTRNQQTSLNNSQAIKNADGSYTIVVSKSDPGVANWVSTGGLNQGTISMRFQGVDPEATNMPRVQTRVVKVSEVEGIVTDPDDPNYNPDQLDYDRTQQIADRQAGYDRRYTV